MRKKYRRKLHFIQLQLAPLQMFSREKKMQGKRMQLLQKNETNELSLRIEFNVEKNEVKEVAKMC